MDAQLPCRALCYKEEIQKKLDKILMVNGIRVDDTINKDLLTIMNRQPGMTEEEKFSSIFWEQQLKAATVKTAKGMRWHPQWCLYLHHKSSGCYSTLRNSGVICLPSECTLRDYRHSSPSTTGFSKATD